MIFTVIESLERAAREWESKDAVVDGETRLTFAELRNEALKYATVLQNLGVKPGDRVGVCMEKSPVQILSILGALYAKAVFVPILPRLKKRNIEHVIADSAMTALIVDKGRMSEVEDFKERLTLITTTELETSLPCLPQLAEHIHAPTAPHALLAVDNAAIIYSSGSTGRPKGIVISHRNLFDGSRIVSQYLGTRHEDRLAAVLSFDFDYGLNQLWQSFHVGCTLYLHRFIFPSDFVQFIERSEITALALMPAIISKIFDKRLFEKDMFGPLRTVRYISSSGGRVAESMVRDLESLFPESEIVLMYGLTEAFRSTYLEPQQVNIRPNSIGKAIPGAEVLILDAEGHECPPETEGELVHRGGVISKGYWNNPSATAQRFRSHPRYPGETLVYSGDIAKKDVDGYIYFVGRADTMIKSQGIRVSPTEVEEGIESIDGVEHCVAFGIQNDEVGQDIVAVYSSHNRQEIDQTLLKNSACQFLARHMVPKFYIWIEHFPVTGNDGKLDRVFAKSHAEEKLSTEGQK